MRNNSTQASLFVVLCLIILQGCSNLAAISDVIFEKPAPKALTPLFDYTHLDVNAFPAGKHASEVLNITALPKESLYQFITLGKDGNILLWSEQSKTPYLAMTVGDSIDVATVDAVHGLVAWTRGTNVSVAPLDFSHQYIYDLPSRAQAIHFTNDGESLLVGGKDAKIYRWRFKFAETAEGKNESEKVLERYVGAAQLVSAVEPHPDGNIFFSGDWAGVIQGWQLYTGNRLGGEGIKNTISSTYFSTSSTRTKGTRIVKDERIERLVINPKGTEIALGTSYGDLELWKVRGLIKIGYLKAHNSDIFALAYSPDGELVATSGRDGNINVYRIHTFTDEEFRLKTDRTYQAEFVVVKTFPVADVRALSFINDHQIVAGTKDGSVLLVDTL